MKYNYHKYSVIISFTFLIIALGFQIAKYTHVPRFDYSGGSIMYVRPYDGSNELCDGLASNPAYFGKPCAFKDAIHAEGLWDGKSSMHIYISPFDVSIDNKMLQRKISFPIKDGFIEIRK